MRQAEVQFGRYTLLERLGKGGMAELYRAVLTGPSGFRKTVAIKKILPKLSRDKQFQVMFLQEGRIMADLSHRNLVQVFELGSVAGEFYISLELINGCDLAEIIRHNRRHKRVFEPCLAAWIAKEICQGLAYVHTFEDHSGPLNIVHRDVNPQNILLSLHGDIKLGDFGIAKSVGGPERKGQNQIKGKLEYLSPEQARGDEARPTSDLYAVGLVLFEMLTSERYIQGADAEQLVEKAANPVWRSTRMYNPLVPEELDHIVKRSLREVPEGRFASAEAFESALNQFIQFSSWVPNNNDIAILVKQCCQSSDSVAGATTQATPASYVSACTDSAEVESEPLPAPNTRPGTVAIKSPEVQDSSNRKKLFWLLAVTGVLVVLGLTLIVSLPDSGGRAISRTGREIEDQVSPDEQIRSAEVVGDPDQVGALDQGEPRPTPGPTQDVALAGQPQAEPDENKTETESENKQLQADSTTLVPAQHDPKPTKALMAGNRLRPRIKKRKFRLGNAKKSKNINKNKTIEKTKLVFIDNTEIQSIEILRNELIRQQQRLRSRGIRAGDSQQIDQLISRANKNLVQEKAAAAQEALADLDKSVDALSIDRSFVERKMARLQQALARVRQQEEYASSTQKILTHVLNSRFDEANQSINHVFDRLSRLKDN